MLNVNTARIGLGGKRVCAVCIWRKNNTISAAKILLGEKTANILENEMTVTGMYEYIERESAIESIMSEPPDAHYPHWYADKIKAISAAEVAPVRHGRWEGYSHTRYCGIDDFGDPIYKDGVVYYCSECMRKTVIKEKYCPSCGAKMDLEEV